MTTKLWKNGWAIAFTAVVLLSSVAVGLGADDGKIDWNKARGIRQKERKGEALTAEEKTYLDRARKSRMRPRRGSRPSTRRSPAKERRPVQRKKYKDFGSPKEFVYKKTLQGELKIYVYYPKDWTKSDKRPGVVFFFGGGWFGGETNHFNVHSVYLAERGMVAACADYRVKSRHDVAPDKCVEDAKSAVRWFRTNAATLGIDPNRIVASGGSAGGHIAACTATTTGLEAKGEDLSVSSKPNALVLFNPALNFMGEIRGRKMLEKLNNDEKLAKQISPTLALTKDTPPALLFFGTEDFLLAQGKEWMDKAKRINHRSELYLAEGKPHGFFSWSPSLEKTARRMDEFLISLGYLKGSPTIKDGQYKDIRTFRRPDDR